MWWSESLGRIELKITLATAKDCSHAGQCDVDVESAMLEPRYRRQLAKLDPDTLKACLKEYGAWEDDELTDHQLNLSRIFWVACCDLAEESRQ